MSGFVEIAPPNERQGEYRYTTLYVWTCGDDVCDCSQVVAERVYWNPLFRGACWFVRIWEGPFFTDGEGYQENQRELLRAWREIRQRYPDEKWGDVTMPTEPWRFA